ncbi:MAG: hypothetical protein ABI716_01340 [Candidatus Saccharibacteria bacterium]
MNEQLPPLNWDKDGNEEPTFWAGEHDDTDNGFETEAGAERSATDYNISPSREELARIALKLNVPTSAKLPPDEGPEIYRG